MDGGCVAGQMEGQVPRMEGWKDTCMDLSLGEKLSVPSLAFPEGI